MYQPGDRTRFIEIMKRHEIPLDSWDAGWVWVFYSTLPSPTDWTQVEAKAAHVPIS